MTRQVTVLTQRVEQLESQLAVEGSNLSVEASTSCNVADGEQQTTTRNPPKITVLESQVKQLSTVVRDHSRKAELEEREAKSPH